MRVKVKFPAQSPLSILHIPVRIGDINYGGHVGNDAILSIMHEARMQMLAGAGFTEMNTGGHGLIMGDVMIAYRAESFYGDILQVAVFADEISMRSFDLLYRVTSVQEDRQTLIAEAKTGMICFDYTARKIVEISDALRLFLTTAGFLA